VTVSRPDPRLFLLILVLAAAVSCNSGGSSSPYTASYLRIDLSSDSVLDFDDIQSVKVFADPYAAFNMHNITEQNRSRLGDYDFTAETKLYLGFLYEPLYVSWIDGLYASVTLKGSQARVTSETYSLTFKGTLPGSDEEKPSVRLKLSGDPASPVLTLVAVQGAEGSPVLSLTPDP